jgi:hypothetical protein
MRELGAPVGVVDHSLTPEEAVRKIRSERLEWVRTRNTHADPICKRNCLDVCIDYNNRAMSTNEKCAEMA